MKIKLVFDDWRRDGKSVYQDNIDLSLRDFHSGTMFDGELVLSDEDAEELKKHLEDGYTPVFYLVQ